MSHSHTLLTEDRDVPELLSGNWGAREQRRRDARVKRSPAGPVRERCRRACHRPAPLLPHAHLLAVPSGAGRGLLGPPTPLPCCLAEPRLSEAGPHHAAGLLASPGPVSEAKTARAPPCWARPAHRCPGSVAGWREVTQLSSWRADV